jgi:tight adherence protein C
VLLAFAAIRELAGTLEGRLSALRAGVSAVAGPRDPARAAAKLGGAAAGAVVAVIVLPVVPARLGVPAALVLVAAGFMAPEALGQRRARQRRERFVAALPDALELLAVGSAAGRGAATLFGELTRGSAGPLAAELRTTVAAIECGTAPRLALQDLRRRLPGAEVAAFAAAVERSRSLGSPLAEQLHLQAVALRSDARRRIEERAARAAPKIQLVVALVLVPSVLLVILAAIVAHADALLAGI